VPKVPGDESGYYNGLLQRLFALVGVMIEVQGVGAHQCPIVAAAAAGADAAAAATL